MAAESCLCLHCGRQLNTEARFCGSCGTPSFLLNEQLLEAKERVIHRHLWYALGSYFVLLGVLILLHVIEFVDLMTSVIFSDLSILAYAMLFSIPVFKTLGSSLRLSGLSGKPLFWLIPVTAIYAVAVILCSQFFNRSFFPDQSDYVSWSATTSFPLFYGLLSTALQPALAEELAFRGVIYGSLNKALGWKSAVVISGFMFALAHLNILSLVWLIPAGIFFGYLRHRYGTIWYGVLCHFLHNAMVVLYELYL